MKSRLLADWLSRTETFQLHLTISSELLFLLDVRMAIMPVRALTFSISDLGDRIQLLAFATKSNAEVLVYFEVLGAVFRGIRRRDMLLEVVETLSLNVKGKAVCNAVTSHHLLLVATNGPTKMVLLAS